MKKYGPAAKVVAGAVLNVVAPGSGALIGLVDKAFDTAGDMAQGRWEAELMRATHQNAAELARLGNLFELLTGDLAKLCDKAFAFHDQPDDIEDIVRRTLASDRGLTDGLRKLDALRNDFACVKEQQRQLLDGQDEMLPIMRRLQCVLPFLEECQRAGANSRELLMHRQAILIGIHLRQPQQARAAVKQIEAGGKHGDTHLFKAGIALIDHDFPSVQSELGEVVRRHPHDNELVELHRRATVMATGVTPRMGEPSRVSDRVEVNLDVGDVLDGWKLEARLGAGGWGQVFKATRGAETVALKIMHVRYSRDADFVARFRGEIRTLMRLPSHPNLLRILDFNYAIERSCWYLVTEYIDGPTLDKYLQDKGALSADQAHKVFAPVTDGLAQAHSAGIVHRDIKPGNFVFRKADQRLVLVDFGLAVHADNVGQTKVGGVTLMFGSPEQKSGLPADARGDVYSLAATISFALLYDKPDLRNPIHFDADEIPMTLRASLAKAMETNPRRRYANGRQFHAALTSTTHVAVELAPREPVAPATKPAQAPAKVKTEAPPPVSAEPPPHSSGKTPTFDLFCPHCNRRVTVAEDKAQQVVKCPLCAKQFMCPSLAPPVKPTRQPGDIITNTLGMKFAYVPPGASWLGGGAGKLGTTPFALEQGLFCGIYPVTQMEWQQVMGNNPSHFSGNPRYPVEKVSWHDVQKFLEKLNSRGDGYSYRLPTEQEWEYICRGGPIEQDQSKYHYYFAKSKTDLTPNPTNDLSNNQANFGNQLKKPSNAGSYLPNPLGINDMHGNVWEWTDSLEGSARQIRGGSWRSLAGDCTASDGRRLVAFDSFSDVGFRLLAVPTSPKLEAPAGNSESLASKKHATGAAEDAARAILAKLRAGKRK